MRKAGNALRITAQPIETGTGAWRGSHTWQGMVFAAMGRIEDARSVLAELADRSEREYFPSSLLAWLCFALEEYDQGFAWLHKAYDERDGWLQMIKAYHAYDRVRDDARYKDFLERMGLEP